MKFNLLAFHFKWVCLQLLCTADQAFVNATENEQNKNFKTKMKPTFHFHTCLIEKGRELINKCS